MQYSTECAKFVARRSTVERENDGGGGGCWQRGGALMVLTCVLVLNEYGVGVGISLFIQYLTANVKPPLI